MASKRPSKRGAQFYFTCQHTAPTSIRSSSFFPNSRRCCARSLRIRSKTPPSPSTVCARQSPLVLARSPGLNVPHTSPIQDMVNQIGKRSGEPRYEFERNDDGCRPGELHAQLDPAALTSLQQALVNAAAASKSGAMFFFCTDWRHLQPVLNIGQASYGALVNIAVWVKDNVSPGVLFDSQHQLIAIFRKGDAEDVKRLERARRAARRSDVWRYPGLARHVSTELVSLVGVLPFKPVALVADAIRDVSRGDALVLDLFGGSGTTLIAAERSGCQAMLLEHDPQCVDL